MVSLPGDGRNGILTEDLAQGADLHLQVVLFHNQPGPDQVKQFVLRDRPVAPFDQRQQHVKGARAQRCWVPIDQQLSLGWPDLKVIESVGSHQLVRMCSARAAHFTRGISIQDVSAPNSGGSRTETGVGRHSASVVHATTEIPMNRSFQPTSAATALRIRRCRRPDHARDRWRNRGPDRALRHRRAARERPAQPIGAALRALCPAPPDNWVCEPRDMASNGFAPKPRSKAVDRSSLGSAFGRIEASARTTVFGR